VRFRPQLLLAPVLLAGYMALATPQVALAANGMTETGTTTYEVVPDKAQIRVTVQVSIYNDKPSQAESGRVTSYYWNNTEMGVEKQAGAVAVSSNAGAVYQTEVSSDRYYRYLKLTYPNVYYGQTRVVTATYTIPAAPHAAGGFRAGKAYASLCAMGNGLDVGTVSVVIPDGYAFYNDAGGEMSPSTTSAGKQTYTSGSLTTPYKFWTCIDAEQEASLMHTPVTAGSQAFDIQAWPEDPAWSAGVGADITTDVPALEALTGLKMPGGTVAILEAGDQQLGEYGGMYNSATSTAQIPETVQKDTVAHELSHIWFNHNLFADKWISEGLAGFSEQAAGAGNFTPCAEPGAYPGTGSPNLKLWQLLNNNSTTQDDQVSAYQYGASCYIFTTLAADMGPANLKLVLKAAYADQMAYVSTTADEKISGASLPLSSKELLDLIDERGMVPAGEDLDTAQTLLAKYGIFDATTLSDRSTARSAYHELASAAKSWKLPPAIREPMANWEFDSAQAAMATAKQIVDSRDSIGKLIPDLSLDGTVLQKQFEAAETQTDLDNLLTLIKAEADAAARVDQATKLSNNSRSILESIGLLGTDVQTPLTQARTDLANVKPESATTGAQRVIDRIDKSSDQGLLRAGSVAGILAVILLLLALVVFLRRRRPTVVVLGPGGGPTGPVLLLPPVNPDAWSGASQWPQGGWEQPGLGSGETPQAGAWAAPPPSTPPAEGPPGAPTAPNDAGEADGVWAPDEDPAEH
jgi:hypothetical protein